MCVCVPISVYEHVCKQGPVDRGFQTGGVSRFGLVLI